MSWSGTELLLSSPMRTSQNHGQVSPLYKNYDSWEPSNVPWRDTWENGMKRRGTVGLPTPPLKWCHAFDFLQQDLGRRNRDNRPLASLNPGSSHPITPGACCRSSVEALLPNE